MSSTISTVQLRTITPKAVTKLQNEERPHALVRTSSIDKIKKFNNYICSQNYYVFPALFSWLKSSQSNLHSSTEKTIFFFRSLLFNSLLYKIYFVGQKFVYKRFQSVSLEVKESALKSKIYITNFYEKFRKLFENVTLLKIEVYLAVVAVISQILICVYFLAFVVIPVGLFFLLGCTGYIVVLFYAALNQKKRKNVRKSRRDETKKKL